MERSTSVAVVEIVDLFLIVGINTKMIPYMKIEVIPYLKNLASVCGRYDT